jgi:apolipoprotein N-acyltransferase
MLLRLAIAIGAGLLLAFSFAPFNFSYLAVIAIILLGAITYKQTLKTTFYLSLSFAMAYLGLGISWVYVSMHNFGNMSVALAVFATFLFVLANAILVVLGIVFARYIKLKGNFSEVAYFVVLLPIGWIAFEWLRSFFLTGFPWLILGSSQLDSPLGGLLPVLGELGVSLILMTSAGILLSLAYLKSNINKFYFLLSVSVIWLSALGLEQVNWTTKQDETIDVVLVQGNIPISRKWDDAYLNKTLETYIKQTKKALPADLIIWPETAIAAVYANVKDTVILELEQFFIKNNATLVTGIVGHNSQGFFHNSLLTIGSSSTNFYHKRHLVPFGEYVPLINGIVGFVMDKFNIPMSNFRPGIDAQSGFKVKNAVIQPSICYEVAYADLVRQNAENTNLLLTVSNDSWFGDSAARYQHLRIAQVRAKENAKYMLRATNDGISAIINHKGKVIKTATQNTDIFIKGSIPMFSGSTPFARFGNLNLLLVCLLMITGLFGFKNRKN